MVVAIVLVLLVVGSVLFHFLSPWYFTPIASNWTAMDDTISITFWVTGFVFVAINLFMAYAVIRYRYRKGKRAQYEPDQCVFRKRHAAVAPPHAHKALVIVLVVGFPEA